MKNTRVFIGTIMKCTQNSEILTPGVGNFHLVEEKKVKENAILVKTKNGFYVDIKGLNLLEVAYLYLEKRTSLYPYDTFMDAYEHGSYMGENFVDINSIKPYADNETKEKKLSLLKLRKQ